MIETVMAVVIWIVFALLALLIVVAALAVAGAVIVGAYFAFSFALLWLYGVCAGTAGGMRNPGAGTEVR